MVAGGRRFIFGRESVPETIPEVQGPDGILVSLGGRPVFGIREPANQDSVVIERLQVISCRQAPFRTDIATKQNCSNFWKMKAVSG
jgi:hypothetical protein